MPDQDILEDLVTLTKLKLVYHNPMPTPNEEPLKQESVESYSIEDINAVLSEYVCFAPNEGCNCKEERRAVEHFIDRLQSKRKSKEECQRECGPSKDSAFFICKHGSMFANIVKI